MQRFGQRFVDKVANPGEILQFSRKAKKREALAGDGGSGAAVGAGEEAAGATRADASAQIERLVGEFLQQDVKSQMKILRTGEMNEAVFVDYVSKGDKSAIEKVVKQALERAQREHDIAPAEGSDRRAMERLIEDTLAGETSGATQAGGAHDGGDAALRDETGDSARMAAPQRGAARGRSAGRGARARRQAQPADVDLAADDDDEPLPAQQGGRAKRARAPSKRATAAASNSRARGQSESDDAEDVGNDLNDVDYSEVVSAARSTRSFSTRRRMR